MELLSSSVPEVQAKAAMAVEMMVEDNGEPHNPLSLTTLNLKLTPAQLAKNQEAVRSFMGIPLLISLLLSYNDLILLHACAAISAMASKNRTLCCLFS